VPDPAGSGRRAVVTGASRGLGLEWVRQLSAAGWSVTACARDPERAPGLTALAAAQPECVRVERLDVSQFDETRQLADRLRSRSDRLDLLVNNAGVNRAGTGDPNRSVGPLPCIDAPALLEVIRTNTVAAVVVTQALAPLLAQAGRSWVVNTSSRLGSLSIAASGSDPYGADYGYRISKAALNMASVALAAELAGQGTVVVSMSPGWVKTDMTSSAADLTVEESVAGQLATVVGLTAADTGRYLAHTGEDIPW
jgi:NAD(P)-dependent dehydrogenase (short-subunit alcohol dehydrogenase family)